MLSPRVAHLGRCGTKEFLTVNRPGSQAVRFSGFDLAQTGTHQPGPLQPTLRPLNAEIGSEFFPLTMLLVAPFVAAAAYQRYLNNCEVERLGGVVADAESGLGSWGSSSGMQSTRKLIPICSLHDYLTQTNIELPEVPYSIVVNGSSKSSRDGCLPIRTGIFIKSLTENGTDKNESNIDSDPVLVLGCLRPSDMSPQKVRAIVDNLIVTIPVLKKTMWELSQKLRPSGESQPTSFSIIYDFRGVGVLNLVQLMWECIRDPEERATMSIRNRFYRLLELEQDEEQESGKQEEQGNMAATSFASVQVHRFILLDGSAGHGAGKWIFTTVNTIRDRIFPCLVRDYRITGPAPLSVLLAENASRLGSGCVKIRFGELDKYQCFQSHSRSSHDGFSVSDCS